VKASENDAAKRYKVILLYRSSLFIAIYRRMAELNDESTPAKERVQLFKLEVNWRKYSRERIQEEQEHPRTYLFGEQGSSLSSQFLPV